ncbi:S1 RNA binding domain protein [Desulfitispora alkaliphila]|uniref:S1 domain-containing RNA-binding protein n=1 Tax=Desulfitispora alkaliphila TaxID=622674 RepID=UPI003D21D23B
MSIAVGSIVEGVVTGITNFGAFVQLPGGVTGLVHISEVADAYVKDVNDFLKEKDKVKVKVINIDDKGKVGLSIKQVNSSGGSSSSSSSASARKAPASKRPPRQQPSVSFEDKLAKFLKESDERQADVKRNTESKRGGRGARY